ncbi:MAG TPA: amidase [Paracoccaceae bacterium]|nr:amidase [Paracoccaceae bacterium]
MNELLNRDAVDLAAMIARREISAAELMEATLARIDEVNPKLNAIVSQIDGEAAMDMARAADRGPVKGPMHGLPLAIKDLADAEGLPTTMGSPAYKDAGPAPKDDIMVARMRAAGALIIGKTNTPEFGLGSHTYNPVWGATRNAWDSSKSAGGSSGGAAVALTTGMMPIADGSDMMGSLRNPAGWANIYGYRPSWGLVPSEPEGDAFLHQLSTAGPMGRSPADVAMTLTVQAGHDPRQPHGRDLPDIEHLNADLKGKRIGWLGDWGGGLPMDEGVLETCEAALKVFDDLGCTVEKVAPPFQLELIWDSWITLRSWSNAASLAALYLEERTRDLMKPEAQWETERGLKLSAMDVHRASVIRSRWFEKAASLFESYDVLVLPTAQVWPFPVEWTWPKQIGGITMDTYHRWMEVVVPAGLIGLPCLAVPAGFGAAGLPIGLQLVGRRGSDVALLQMGQGWHNAAPWVHLRPEAT